MTPGWRRRDLLAHGWAAAGLGVGGLLAGWCAGAAAQPAGAPPSPAPGAEGRVQLPVPNALSVALVQALAQQQPLVVMASLPGCPYCRAVRDGHLGPLMAEQQRRVVQLDLRSQRAVLDFEGRSTDHDTLLRGWGVRVAPTLLFFGRSGREVAPRLVGMALPDFYGAYLDDRLAQATRVVLTG